MAEAQLTLKPAESSPQIASVPESTATLEAAEKELTPRERAIVRAWYAAGCKNMATAGKAYGMAESRARHLFREPRVLRYREAIEQLAAHELGVNAYSLMEKGLQVYDRSMGEGQDFSPSAAIKALEFLRSMGRVVSETDPGANRGMAGVQAVVNVVINSE